MTFEKIMKWSENIFELKELVKIIFEPHRGTGLFNFHSLDHRTKIAESLKA